MDVILQSLIFLNLVVELHHPVKGYNVTITDKWWLSQGFLSLLVMCDRTTQAMQTKWKKALLRVLNHINVCLFEFFTKLLLCNVKLLKDINDNETINS